MKGFKTSLAILAAGAIGIAGMMEQGETARRAIEAANHTPPPAVVCEVQTASVTEDEAPPFLGDFRITVYTPTCDGGVWGYQTATGVTSEHLTTCAVDPEVIPLGTVLDIGGALTVTAVDTGSAVTGNVIDIFFDGTAGDALAWIAEFGDSAPVWVQQEVKQ